MRMSPRTFRVVVVLEGVWIDEDNYYLEDVIEDACVDIDNNVRGKVTDVRCTVDCSRPWLGMWNNP